MKIGIYSDSYADSERYLGNTNKDSLPMGIIFTKTQKLRNNQLRHRGSINNLCQRIYQTHFAHYRG